MEIIAIGSSQFTLGFELAGVRTFESKNASEVKKTITPQTGIIIIDEELMKSFDDEDRRSFEDSLRPLFVVMSKTSEQDSLNRLIKRSIGIEL